MPVIIAFIDFKKAFDSMEINVVLRAREKQWVWSNCTEILKECKEGCYTQITLFENPIRIPVSKDVKQGDTVSPELFSVVLENVMRKLNWATEININGEKLDHLYSADDVVLSASNVKIVGRMINQLQKERGIQTEDQ